jgi:uncharacterized protein (TIGR00369 family)
MKTAFVQILREHIGKDDNEISVGLSKWLKGRVEAVHDDGSVDISFVIREDMLNPLGILHGGSVAAIVDDCMGMQLFVSTDEGSYVAVNLHVDFLGKGVLGERIVAKPRVHRFGRSTAYVTCEVFNQQGKLMARASSNFSRIA